MDNKRKDLIDIIKEKSPLAGQLTIPKTGFQIFLFLPLLFFSTTFLLLYIFDLKNDPSEQNNIATENPNLVDEMERLLSKYSEIKNPEIHEGNDETSKIKEELKKMGYI